MLYPNPTSPPDGEHLVTVHDARLILGGIARATLRKLVADGKLRSVQIGARVMFRRADLTTFIVGNAPDLSFRKPETRGADR